MPPTRKQNNKKTEGRTFSTPYSTSRRGRSSNTTPSQPAASTSAAASASASAQTPRGRVGRPPTGKFDAVDAPGEDIPVGEGRSVSCQWGSRTVPCDCAKPVESCLVGHVVAGCGMEIPPGHKIWDHLVACHGADIPSESASLPKKKASRRFVCRWGKCTKDTSWYGRLRHLSHAHADQGKRRCLWCGRTERLHEYHQRHGSARHCRRRAPQLEVLANPSSREAFLAGASAALANGADPAFLAGLIQETTRDMAHVAPLVLSILGMDITSTPSSSGSPTSTAEVDSPRTPNIFTIPPVTDEERRLIEEMNAICAMDCPPLKDNTPRRLDAYEASPLSNMGINDGYGEDPLADLWLKGHWDDSSLDAYDSGDS